MHESMLQRSHVFLERREPRHSATTRWVSATAPQGSLIQSAKALPAGPIPGGVLASATPSPALFLEFTAGSTERRSLFHSSSLPILMALFPYHIPLGHLCRRCTISKERPVSSYHHFLTSLNTHFSRSIYPALLKQHSVMKHRQENRKDTNNALRAHAGRHKAEVKEIVVVEVAS